VPTTTSGLVQDFYAKGTAADQNESDPVLNTTTPAIVVRNNPARFAFVVSNNTAQVISVSNNPAMTFASGMQVPPGGTYSSVWTEDLDGPARALYGLIAIGTGSVHCLEEFLVEGAPAFGQ
jgi:hypothetical protein